MRIPSYLDCLRKGRRRAGAALTAIRESPGIFVGDAHWGFGQTQAQRLTRRLIDMARATGLAVGTLVHSCHVGRLGEYCEMAADAGLVSMMMVNTHGHARRVAPPGGKAPRLGTNPLAIGVPAPGGPLILDFGTSATAEGKVRVKRIAGQTCPDGWLLDSEGRPTNDPNTLYGNPPGTILPMGGDQAYKGFGLGLMVEIFAGALSGGVVHSRSADQSERQLRVHAGRRSRRTWAAPNTLPAKSPAWPSSSEAARRIDGVQRDSAARRSRAAHAGGALATTAFRSTTATGPSW